MRLNFKDYLRLIWMRWADAIIFYSESRKDDVVNLGCNKPACFVAPNTIDTGKYQVLWERLQIETKLRVTSRLGLGMCNMIYVGRLVSEKGVMDLIDLARWCENWPKPPSLIIVGGGELEQPLRKALQDYAARVKFLGPIFDSILLGELLYCANIMVCTGYVGLNVVDSLSMGCPFATINDRNLDKRHSPEISYLRAGENAIIADNLEELGMRLRLWFERGEGISLNKEEIRREFLQSTSIEEQFSGMKAAFESLSKS